jgi:acyl-CoA thioesterase YciA
MEHVSSKLCLVKDVGLNGNLFGGNMLAWMDEIAAIYAMKVTGEKSLVTLRFGEITFKRPVKVNDIVDFYCNVIKQGKTSVTIVIGGKVGDKIVFTTDCTFVAIDEEGNKKEINWDGK